MRMLTIMTMLTCFFWLSACGKKGPLYLPDDNAASQTPSNATNALRLHPQEKS